MSLTLHILNKNVCSVSLNLYMKRILNSFKFREPQRLTFQNDMRKIPLYKKWAKPLPHFYYLRPLTLTLSQKRGEGILCVIAGMTRNRTIAATLQKLPLPFPPLQKRWLRVKPFCILFIITLCHSYNGTYQLLFELQKRKSGKFSGLSFLLVLFFIKPIL